MPKKFAAGLGLAVALATTAQAQTILTAETSSPNTAPGISIISLSEAAAKNGIADIQVTSGQRRHDDLGVYRHQSEHRSSVA